MATLREQPANSNFKPSTLAYWPRYANNLQPSTFNLQPWPIGHATRTTFNLQPSTLAYWPRYANNLQPSTFTIDWAW
ncbi:MAG: hypothetical protein F6J94_23165 [Moorea sp. SIO1F2]|uniref:hypothetical protein n=1 Tax=Moorena sp. SIO1F2 TaxID=2607819 RepID=UPI0013B942CC|nr:hypothetical protein [Moorena sp. SIO1F2]NET84708.1 hypothetical protein [Moorena sp. SIO1F2]